MISFVKSYYYPLDIDQIKIDCKGKSGVYLVLNNINSKFYIGSAISKNEKFNRLYIRFKNHFFHNHKVSNIYLKNSMKKYGKSNFSFHIITYSDISSTRDLELKYIKLFKPHFNFLSFGSGTFSYKHNEIIKLKMKKNSGRKGKPPWNKGLLFSDKTIKLMSIASKERHKVKKKNSFDYSFFSKLKSKPTSSYNAKSGNLIKNYSSAKDLWRDYNHFISYRTVRRHLKSGLPINKLNIIVKYNL